MRSEASNQINTSDTRSIAALRVIIGILVAAIMLVGGYILFRGGLDSSALVTAAPVVDEEPSTAGTDANTTIPATTTTAVTIATTSLPTLQVPPLPGPRTVIPLTEAEPEAKQLAVDIAYALTTYEAADDHVERLRDLVGSDHVDELALVSAPLTHPGYWSRGEVVYPQMGGLRNDRASVMVVISQTLGSGSEDAFSVVRTLDIRLVRGESGWEFDALSSAGGEFDNLDDLSAAHAVASDPRIVMPDSARLDILDGRISPRLLELMVDLADQTTYDVVVLATGHPHNVFETDRVSHHTVGQAIDINRIGDRLVIDDRDPDSATRTIVGWLFDHPDVIEVGSPWDIDGPASSRSFTDAVHQDHIHFAVG
jgi:hypothetical protein